MPRRSVAIEFNGFNYIASTASVYRGFRQRSYIRQGARHCVPVEWYYWAISGAYILRGRICTLFRDSKGEIYNFLAAAARFIPTTDKYRGLLATPILIIAASQIKSPFSTPILSHRRTSEPDQRRLRDTSLNDSTDRHQKRAHNISAGTTSISKRLRSTRTRFRSGFNRKIKRKRSC
jgi:hypothetical protein